MSLRAVLFCSIVVAICEAKYVGLLMQPLIADDFEVPLDSKNVVTVPPCPDGQQLVNGVCRDIWRFLENNLDPLLRNADTLNVVTVPPCPDGQQLVNGVCRDIWRISEDLEVAFDTKNVVTVPPCPSGQQLVNGVCTDIWRSQNLI